MKVQLNLYASLAVKLPAGRKGNSCDMDLDEGTTVEKLFAGLEIPADSPKITFVNGVHAEPNRVLEEGDRVAVFPPVAGG